MVIAFDLDDTLYDESTYVESGFRAVAEYAQRAWGWNASSSLDELNILLGAQGRGKIFDSWLQAKGRVNKLAVRKCVSVYRSHEPNIVLYPGLDAILARLSREHRLYLVTDGNKLVQARKVSALRLWDRFERVFITHRFGVAAAKPSTYCFERIKEIEKCDWGAITYVGDNPAKDFIGLNQVGGNTVRVLSGMHRTVLASWPANAGATITALTELEATVAEFGRFEKTVSVETKRVPQATSSV